MNRNKDEYVTRKELEKELRKIKGKKPVVTIETKKITDYVYEVGKEEYQSIIFPNKKYNPTLTPNKKNENYFQLISEGNDKYFNNVKEINSLSPIHSDN